MDQWGRQAVRILWVPPRFGARLAELITVPVVLLLVAVARKCPGDRVTAPPNPARKLAPSGVAFCLLLLADLMVGPLLGQLPLTSFFTDAGGIGPILYYLVLGVLALAALFVVRR
ncbi:MAG: hypothetical protein ACXWCY_32110 [Burkholderiales bacterium]